MSRPSFHCLHRISRGLCASAPARLSCRSSPSTPSRLASSPFSTSSNSRLPLVHLWPPGHHPQDPAEAQSTITTSNTTMAPAANVDFDRALGHSEADQPVSWNRRDLLLYAVGIGAGPEDLDYVYEMSHGFRAIPTYPVVLAHKGNSIDTTIFADMISSRSGTPGFPVLSPNTIVHGEQSIQILAPIPTTSGEGWKLRKRVVGIRDTKSGLILESESRLISPVNRVHAIMIGSAFYRGGGQGTGFDKSLVTKPPLGRVPSDSAPAFTLSEKTTVAQAALYRLSGDYNPLHIDPSIGQKGGLGGVILHGLCSFGHAARAVLKAVEPKDGQADAPHPALLAFSARFTAPVKPGDELETKVWITGEKDGEVELAFEQSVVGGKKSLGGGYAKIRKAQGKSAKL